MSYDEIVLQPGEELPVRVLAERRGRPQITHDGLPDSVFVVRAEVWNRGVCEGLTSPTRLSHVEVPAGAPFRAWLRNVGTTPTRARLHLA